MSVTWLIFLGAIGLIARQCVSEWRGDLGEGQNNDKLTETCQLETMEGRCQWRSEVIVMTSARWGRMKTGRCLDIHPNALAALGHDPLFIGCSEDVLSVMDMKCSGRTSCDVRIPDPVLDEITPCYPDQTRYLETSYVCVKAVQESRRCVVSVTSEAQFISSSSSDDVNSVSSCGSKSHPWRLEAAAGQRINISLLDFTAMSMSPMTAEKRPRDRDRVTCRQYGYVLEKLNKRNVSVCAGGGAQLRQSHVYVSQSNNLQIVKSHAASSAERDGQNYLIRVEAVGCTNMVPPENAWLRRSNNDIIIGCYSSQQTWQLNCDGRQWKGLVGTCPELYVGTVQTAEKAAEDDSLQVLLVMVVIAVSAVIICIAVICIGCFCLRRYKRDSMKKLKMSNGGATDIYQSNSRCVRNNDKPVDNSVFTGRLPVSAGPQHHQQWQQQQQHQLLMQADDAREKDFVHEFTA